MQETPNEMVVVWKAHCYSRNKIVLVYAVA